MNKLKLFFILSTLFLQSCSNSDDKKIETSSILESTNIEVRSKTSGNLIKTYVREGQFVHKNDTLFSIDNSELLILYNQAVANYNAALAKYQTISKGVREEDIAQLREILRQAQINYENALKDFQRIKNLFEENSVSQKVYDDAKLKLEITDAQLKSAKENLLKAERGPLKSEIDAVKASVDAAKAQVDLLKKRIDDSVILSPSDGYISIINFDEGEVIPTGAVITKIINPDEIHAKIYLNSIEIGKLRLGQKVEIKPDALPDKTFEGKIVFISNEAEFTPKNIQTKNERVKLVYAVKINIPNPEHLLKDGMMCDVVITVEQ